MKLKILVTGGAGYLGSRLVPALLEKGFCVCVTDNFMYSQASLFACASHPGFSVIRGDAADRAVVKEAMQDCDIIIPLACLTGAPVCREKPDEAKRVNLEAVRDILSLKGTGQKILFPNTNSGYGIGKTDIYCTEESPLLPVSFYGKLKVEAEKAIMEKGGAVSFRFATVFGMSPRMRLDLLVNDFVHRAVTDGYIVLYESHFKRNYIHILDVVDVFIHAIEHFDEMENQVYNVGLENANLSKKELCLEIKKAVPGLLILEAGIGKDEDQRNYIVSNAKIRKTGFAAKRSLSSGIAELIKGMAMMPKNPMSNI